MRQSSSVPWHCLRRDVRPQRQLSREISAGSSSSFRTGTITPVSRPSVGEYRSMCKCLSSVMSQVTGAMRSHRADGFCSFHSGSRHPLRATHRRKTPSGGISGRAGSALPESRGHGRRARFHWLVQSQNMAPARDFAQQRVPPVPGLSRRAGRLSTWNLEEQAWSSANC